MENKTEKVYKTSEYERARRKRWRDNNIEKSRKLVREWLKNHPETHNASNKRYNQSHPDKIREIQKRYNERQKRIRIGFKELAKIDITIF